MKTTEDVKRLVAVLTDEQRQLLKDTINKGGWCDGEFDFLRYPAATGSDNTETCMMCGYITNYAQLAGHFQGRQISAMFRSIYNKLCSYNRHMIGHVISHCHNWFGNGSGDMLFIRDEYVSAFEQWATE